MKKHEKTRKTISPFFRRFLKKSKKLKKTRILIEKFGKLIIFTK